VLRRAVCVVNSTKLTNVVLPDGGSMVGLSTFGNGPKCRFPASLAQEGESWQKFHKSMPSIFPNQHAQHGESHTMGTAGEDEETRLARQALLQAAAVGPVRVRCVGRADYASMYQVLNQRSHRHFSLETLRQAALSAHTPFTVEK